ncbi:MAG: DEAD/DEAH box helicase [Bacteroidaceae bacterium]|nr:DEAD/DEAH box helicase [Bacteroidaceae bacterium]
MKTFEELGVIPEICEAISELGFEYPMPVQEEVIPYLLGNGNDVIALAQTGTGKTAAFGLPIIQKVDPALPYAQALILSPTRELCLQIADDLASFSKYVEGLRVVPMYGGTSIENQIRNVRKGVHIIVATPGRLIDLMERGVVKLSTVRDVVLDEADEMLNMGFTDSINRILEDVPRDRNTLLFSATMSKEIARIAKNYLTDPHEIVIGNKNEGSKNVNHVYYMVHAKDKYLALKRIADYYPNIYGIIFCRTRMETQEIADKLIQDGYNADALHGELSQQQRDLTMQKFRKRRIQLLVATDVAARGLDVDDLTHVINYGLPDDTENYTHRSGRTGRAGKRGTSIAIINLREKGRMREIEKAIGKEFVKGTIPTGKEICEKQLWKVIDDIEKTEVKEDDIAEFLPAIYRKLDWLDKEDIIRRVVTREFGRFVEYYSNAPEPEAVVERGAKGERKDKSEGGKRQRREKGDGPRKPEQGYARFFVNRGKRDGFYAAQVIDMVNRHVRHERIEMGRIDLMQNFSFFEVPEKQADAVMRALKHAHVNGQHVVVELAGEEGRPPLTPPKEGDFKPRGKKESSRKRERDEQADGFAQFEKKNKRETKNSESSKVTPPWEGQGGGHRRPSREERGYTSKRGPMKKDDWKQFFQQDERPLRGAEPDFSEEGWARRKPKKK